jgi:hypothetical protein
MGERLQGTPGIGHVVVLRMTSMHGADKGSARADEQVMK